MQTQITTVKWTTVTEPERDFAHDTLVLVSELATSKENFQEESRRLQHLQKVLAQQLKALRKARSRADKERAKLARMLRAADGQS